MDGSVPTQARQQKHYEFEDSLKQLKQAIDRIEDLNNLVCGTEVPRDQKEPSAVNHLPLATFLEQGPSFVLNQAERLAKLRSSLHEALF